MVLIYGEAEKQITLKMRGMEGKKSTQRDMMSGRITLIVNQDLMEALWCDLPTRALEDVRISDFPLHSPKRFTGRGLLPKLYHGFNALRQLSRGTHRAHGLV